MHLGEQLQINRKISDFMRGHSRFVASCQSCIPAPHDTFQMIFLFEVFVHGKSEMAAFILLFDYTCNLFL